MTKTEMDKQVRLVCRMRRLSLPQPGNVVPFETTEAGRSARAPYLKTA